MTALNFFFQLQKQLNKMLPVVKAFRTHLQNLGYSHVSVSSYSHSVASFFAHAGNDGTDPGSVTPAQIEHFYEWLQVCPNKLGGGLSSATIQNYMQGLRVFFGWLEQSGAVSSNPISTLYFKRVVSTPREPLTPDQMQALFSAAATALEQAFLHVLYSCGLRQREALLLNCEDVHYSARMLYVRRGKGAKRRAIPLTEKVSDALESYVLTGRKAPAAERAFLLNSRGQRMSINTCNKALKQLVQRAGLVRVVTAHYLRHSIATHLLASGVAIEQVRDFLGHSQLITTQVYTQVYSHQLKDL